MPRSPAGTPPGRRGLVATRPGDAEAAVERSVSPKPRHEHAGDAVAVAADNDSILRVDEERLADARGAATRFDDAGRAEGNVGASVGKEPRDGERQACRPDETRLTGDDDLAVVLDRDAAAEVEIWCRA